MNGTETIAEAGPYSYTSPHDDNPHMTATLIGYARCSTDRQDPAAQRQALLELGVVEDRIYTDHGLTGTTRARARPRLDQALAAGREGDTLVVPKLGRLARSVPDARAIADLLRERGVKLALGRALYDPDDPIGKMFFNILAIFAEFEADLIRMRTREGMAIARARGNCAANSPNCLTDSSGNAATCMPPASIPSAISPNSAPSQDQPSIARSTDAIPLLAYDLAPYRNRPDIPRDRAQVRLRRKTAHQETQRQRTRQADGATQIHHRHQLAMRTFSLSIYRDGIAGQQHIDKLCANLTSPSSPSIGIGPGPFAFPCPSSLVARHGPSLRWIRG